MSTSMKARFNAQNLLEHIKPELDYYANQHYNGDSTKAFRHWAFKEVFADAEFDDSAVIEKTRIDRTSDLGVDGWWADEENRTFRIVQSKSSRTNVTQDEIDKLLSTPEKLTNPKLVERGNDDVKSLAYEYGRLREEGWAVELVLLSAGRITATMRTRVHGFNADHQDDVISCKFLGLADLADIYDKNLSIGLQKPQVTLQLQSRVYYELPEGSTVGRTLVATIRAKELVKAYEQWKDIIFGRNPRLYLGRNTQINRSIALTVDDENERSRFVNYNNGIRVICDDYQIKRGKVVVNNFQVVNGCQTTVSLWHKRNSLDSSVLVDIKVIQANEDRYWHNISKYTNSQAALQPRNFVSDYTDQARIKDEFRFLPPYYFYEIRRGEWNQFKSTNQAQAVTFAEPGGKERVLNVRQIAQTSLALNGRPGEAKDETRYVFVSKSARGQTKSYYDFAFPEGITARELLLSWEIYTRVDAEAKKAIKEIEGASNSSQDKPSKDHLLFGRFHTTWLVGQLLRQAFVNLDPSSAQKLVNSIDAWFPVAYNVSRTALEASVSHTRGQEGERYTHRSFFREGRYYSVLQTHLEEEIKFNKETRRFDVIDDIKQKVQEM